MLRIISIAAPLLAAAAAKKAVDIAWVAFSGDEPPALNDPDVPIERIIAFTAATAAAIAVAQALASRGVLRYSARLGG